jgi:predicted metal-dependent phosphoesterase TrpH
LIDLHTHTNESDGTYTPDELIQAALDAGLEALAITDHDTFTGYELALPLARRRGLDLICGIGMSTRMVLKQGQGATRTVHLLGYFLLAPPSPEFQAWLAELQAGRRERNIRLVEKLKSMGVAIELEQVQALGRSLTGRPHFAKFLVQNGHAQTSEQAFRDYIGEDAPGFVERDSPFLPGAIQRVLAAGGVPVLAHPIRLGIRNREEEEAAIAEMRDAGLLGIEVQHSDHSAADRARYRAIADKYELAASGGSDFHGAVKPQIKLGSGIHGNVQAPKAWLDHMREIAAARAARMEHQ